MKKVRKVMQNGWFWLKLSAAVLVIILIIYAGIKSDEMIESIISFFGIEKKDKRVKIKIHNVEKKETGSNKTEKTRKFIQQLKENYL